MIVGGEQMGDKGIISPTISMWLPNAVFFIFGLIVTYTSYKEKHLIDLDRFNQKLKKLTSRFS